jgi:hypothetical protein
MARNNQAACQSFLIERRAGRLAVRRSTALRLTRACSTQLRSSGIPGLRSFFDGIGKSFSDVSDNNVLIRDRLNTYKESRKEGNQDMKIIFYS